MKFVIDLFPVVVFFLAYYLYPDRATAIYFATLMTIGAAVLQVIVSRLLFKRFDKMHLATLALILVLGGLTLLLRDKGFIQWKPTLVSWLFAGVFLVSRYTRGHSLPRRFMQQALRLPDQLWEQLNLTWVLFFAASGAANLYVAYYFSEATWVNVKLAMPLFSLVFVVAQAIVIARVPGAINKEPEP